VTGAALALVCSRELSAFLATLQDSFGATSPRKQRRDQSITFLEVCRSVETEVEICRGTEGNRLPSQLERNRRSALLEGEHDAEGSAADTAAAAAALTRTSGGASLGGALSGGTRVPTAGSLHKVARVES
jgi:hypothetical protein